MVFDRSTYTEIWLDLMSGEALGILSSAYWQDAYGVDGQVTLEHTNSGTRWPVLVTEDPGDGGARTSFFGHLSLASLPDGIYAVHGKCRDVIGNYTVVGAVTNPGTATRFETLGFELVTDGSSQAESLTTRLAITFLRQPAVQVPAHRAATTLVALGFSCKAVVRVAPAGGLGLTVPARPGHGVVAVPVPETKATSVVAAPTLKASVAARADRSITLACPAAGHRPTIPLAFGPSLRLRVEATDERRTIRLRVGA